MHLQYKVEAGCSIYIESITVKELAPSLGVNECSPQQGHSHLWLQIQLTLLLQIGSNASQLGTLLANVTELAVSILPHAH